MHALEEHELHRHEPVVALPPVRGKHARRLARRKRFALEQRRAHQRVQRVVLRLHDVDVAGVMKVQAVEQLVVMREEPLLALAQTRDALGHRHDEPREVLAVVERVHGAEHAALGAAVVERPHALGGSQVVDVFHEVDRELRRHLAGAPQTRIARIAAAIPVILGRCERNEIAVEIRDGARKHLGAQVHEFRERNLLQQRIFQASVPPVERAHCSRRLFEGGSHGHAMAHSRHIPLPHLSRDRYLQDAPRCIGRRTPHRRPFAAHVERTPFARGFIQAGHEFHHAVGASPQPSFPTSPLHDEGNHRSRHIHVRSPFTRFLSRFIITR